MTTRFLISSENIILNRLICITEIIEITIMRILLCFIILTAVVFCQEGPLRQTTYGPVRGTYEIEEGKAINSPIFIHSHSFIHSFDFIHLHSFVQFYLFALIHTCHLIIKCINGMYNTLL